MKADGKRLGDRLASAALWTTAVATIAGITHIASILAMPRLAPNDAFARMGRLAPLHQTTPLVAAAPFDDPALAQAVCRYDLSRAPTRLRAALSPDALVTLSFNARYGEIFYSMTDRSATRGRLDVLLLTRAQLDRVEQEDSEDELPQELRIVSPTLEGFVLVRSLAERVGERDDARRRVASVACGPDGATARK